MDSFKQLLNACQNLENSLKKANIGAISSSCETRNEVWKVLIMKKLNDLKLLNSKALLLNATVGKDLIEDINVSSNITKQQLRNTMDVHSRWNHCLKFIAISKALFIFFKTNNIEKIKEYKKIIQKFSNVDQILASLTLSELSKTKELQVICTEWLNIADQWNNKKKVIKKNVEEPTLNNISDINSELHRLMTKMEVMKAIQGRLLASSQQYNWFEDPAKLNEFLVTSRNPPFKAENFL